MFSAPDLDGSFLLWVDAGDGGPIILAWDPG